MGLTISVSAKLINSFGEVLDCRKSTYDNLEMAVMYANTCILSGEPDCVMDTHFVIHSNNGKIAFQGNWDFLKQLFEVEKEERENFKKAHGSDFSEEELIRFLYDVEIWIINRTDIDDYESSEFPIGYFEGSQRQVIDYIQKRNNEESKSKVLYDYIFVDKLN